MESTKERKVAILKWIDQILGQEVKRFEEMVPDASTRRYYRIHTPQTSYVLMDAPPPMGTHPFIAIASTLSRFGLNVPEVKAADVDNGFLLLVDLGDETFLHAFQERGSIELANDLYGQAINALVAMQGIKQIDGYNLPAFDASWYANEWSWHKEWFLEKWLGLSYADKEAGLDQCYQLLTESALSQPQLFMHRDYHSANLMHLPKGGIGILDFQDAFIGPVTYDLASLLRDCYISWPEENIKTWALKHAELLRQHGYLEKVDDATFLRWFDLMSIQRHLKALMTFSRKHVRDQDAKYLQHVPRTLNYIRIVSARYAELEVLTNFYATEVLQRQGELCAQ